MGNAQNLRRIKQRKGSDNSKTSNRNKHKKSPTKQAKDLPCRAVTQYLIYYLRTVLKS